MEKLSAVQTKSDKFMSNELILKSENKAIRFAISYDNTIKGGWCELIFCDGSKKIKLGGYDTKTIFSKLLIGFLPLKERNYFTYSGMKLFTVMCISPHAVIAGREDDDRLKLFFIDTQGKIFPLLYITDEIKIKWISEIISFLAEN